MSGSSFHIERTGNVNVDIKAFLFKWLTLFVHAWGGGGGGGGGGGDIHSKTPMAVLSEDCEWTGNFIHTS